MHKEYAYDFCQKEFYNHVDWLVNILPDSTNDYVKQKTRTEIISAFQRIQELTLNQYCEEHDLCTVCAEPKGFKNCEYKYAHD